MSTMYYIFFAIPFFFLTMWVEYVYGKKRPERAGRGYAKKDTLASPDDGRGQRHIFHGVQGGQRRHVGVALTSFACSTSPMSGGRGCC